MAETPADPADAIAAALFRMRGRRMPRPPLTEGAMPDGAHGGWGRGPHATHGHGGHSRDPGQQAHGHSHGGTHGHGGPPPWLAGARLGGPARLRLLDALAAASHPLSVGEIADAVGVDQPRASRLVQQGVEMGFARREADPDDARRTRVALTDAGRSIVRGFRGERRDAIDTALNDFTDEERADLARLLTKLADAWPR